MTLPSKISLPANSELDPNGIDGHSPGAKLGAGKTQPELVFGGYARVLNEVAGIAAFGAVKYSNEKARRQFPTDGLRPFPCRPSAGLLSRLASTWDRAGRAYQGTQGGVTVYLYSTLKP